MTSRRRGQSRLVVWLLGFFALGVCGALLFVRVRGSWYPDLALFVHGARASFFERIASDDGRFTEGAGFRDRSAVIGRHRTEIADDSTAVVAFLAW